ncbi:MAG: hypothetical protein HYY84_05710 [Deltaproteobacteria bacterium]|nr:hypothetical protein [Deltaproteobacteria bacterium]
MAQQTIADRYEVERVFADSGGMGLIYLAHDRRAFGNPVLIKTTRYDNSENAKHFAYTVDDAVLHIGKTRRILEWEKKMLIRFKDERIENIPNVNDFVYAPSITLKPRHTGKMGEYALPADVVAREPFLVLEKIPGDNLEKLVARPEFRPRAEIVALKCARELCTILLKLHKPFDLKGQKAYFIFQDMKPANLIVSGDDHFTLIDFGGLTLKLGDATTEPTAGVLTRGYMAPEAQGGNEIRIDHRFDIYGVGATLYHILTGIDPRSLSGESPVLDVRALARAGVSLETSRVVARALERQPEKRYQSAAEMRRDLMAILQSRGAA